MGASRISSVLFDLKDHDAATSVQDDDSGPKPPHFELCKWVSSNQENSGSRESEAKDNESPLSRSGSTQLRHRAMPQKSESEEQRPENRASTPVADDQLWIF